MKIDSSFGVKTVYSNTTNESEFDGIPPLHMQRFKSINGWAKMTSEQKWSIIDRYYYGDSEVGRRARTEKI